MTTDTKPTLPAARLAKIREALAAFEACPVASALQDDAAYDCARALGEVLAHLDALTAPADGEALGRLMWKLGAHRMSKAEEDWLWDTMPADRKTKYVKGAIALDAHGYARGRAEALEGIDRWKMIAEGKDVRIAVLRDEIARLTAELAEARAETDRLRQALADARATIVAAPFDDSTIAAVMAAQVKATFDKMLPGLRAELGAQIAERARREGAREEREAAIAELTVLRNGSDARADERIIAFDEAIDCLRQRASDEPTPVEGEDGAT